MHDDKYMKKVLSLLKKRYSKSLQTPLDHSNEWQLLVATMLSAQAQDR
jgi:endonuclease III